MSGGLRFLPWVRDGVAAGLGRSGPLVIATPPARATVTVGVTVHGGPTGPFSPTTKAVLHGPGDVTGLDPRQIIRTYPAPGADGVEPTGFAFVEFDRPDLPWAFTPAAPDPEGRLRPWLTLVVVPESRATLTPAAPGRPPVLTCPPEELPDLAESWAWAHAQVVLDSAGQSVADALAKPERNLSRIICPRKLEPAITYLAAVVPAFDLGREAGLGIVSGKPQAKPAWTRERSDPLPVYHHWRFTTGAEGDFETLVRRLARTELPGTVGRRQMYVPPLDGTIGGYTGFEGGLRAAALSTSGWNIAGPWSARLLALLGQSATRLTPPVYGLGYLTNTTLPATDPQHWLRQLNLDPRYRGAAAIGASIVRDQQEELAAAAWTQAGEIREANELLRRAQLARELGNELFDRRYLARLPAAARLRASASAARGRLAREGTTADTVNGEAAQDPGHTDTAGAAAAPAPNAALLSLASGALGKITVPAPLAAVTADALADAPAEAAAAQAALADTVAGRLGANVSAEAAASAEFRRMLRPFGPLARRAGVAEARGELLDGLADNRIRVVPKADETRPWVPPVPYEENPEDLHVDTPGGQINQMGHALPGVRFFMPLRDGRLYEMRRLDGRWTFRDHGRPPDGPGGTRRHVVAVARGSTTDGSVWCVTNGGELAGRRWDGNLWRWTVAGPPPQGRMTGPPAAMDQTVLVVGTGDVVWSYSQPARTWESLGRPYITVGSERRYLRLGSALDFWIYSTSEPIVGGAPEDAPFSHRLVAARRTTGGTWEWTELTQTPTSGVSDLARKDNDFWMTGGTGRLHAWTAHLFPKWTEYGSPAPWGEPFGDEVFGRPAPTRDHVIVRRRSRFGEDWAALSLTGTTPTWKVPQGQPGSPTAGLSGAVDERTVFVPYGSRLLEVTDGTPGTLHQVPWHTRGGTGKDTDPPPADPARWACPAGEGAALLVSHLDNPSGANALYYRVGANLDREGATSTWDDPVPRRLQYGAESAAAALTTVRLDDTDRPDLIALNLDPSVLHPANFTVSYRVAKNLDASGNPTGGWSTPKTLPESVYGWLVGADIATADLDGDGRPELIFVYAVGDQIFYRIGWCLDTNGDVTQGWTESIVVPGVHNPAHGIAADIADIDLDGTPDLLVAAVEPSPQGAALTYLVGRAVNRRGLVTGGWTAKARVPLGTQAGHQGLGVAMADFTGTRQPDLVVFRLENGPTDNSGYLRTGLDLHYPVGAGPDDPPVARRWTAERRVPGWFGWENSGASIAIADLFQPGSPQEVVRGRFATAHTAVTGWFDGVAAQPDELTRVATAPLADALRTGLAPDRTVHARISARLTVIPAPGTPAFSRTTESADAGASTAALSTADPLRPLLAAVRFPVPTYELLRRVSPDLVLPGIEQVPPDSVSLLVTNRAFMEAFLVGMNHELARELLWREFPAQPKHTYFTRFWDTRGQTPREDILPLQQWVRGALGSHAPSGTAEELVLVIRGELLRRYPSASVTVRKARWNGGVRELDTEERRPVFSAWFSPDMMLLGMPITARQARGENGEAGWFVVLREQPSALRFGVDEPPPGASTTPPAAWDELHWGHVVRSAPQPGAPVFAAAEHTPVHRHTAQEATYGLNSGHMARVVVQRPALIAVHATDLLPGAPA
ncbi:FG-GAP repeat domain-containing protein [Sinosporangium siamense]|uniref:Uncharacterized protein n=1 Tax=Sinosporangium siamense TaxID=1367973 RepID=A0A919RPH6_9ACTN|nr:VCBS repeat-containing protein [Sinosporangium siamense]GII97468.1 hypothetical protein Ssi02_76990 [Sinosporangium siamense]